MKYIVILGDGMADEPNIKLGGKTPLEVAFKPNIDYCAMKGSCGMVQTIPAGMKAGSDVANLAVLGYDPRECYTGRAPLEALNMGLTIQDGDMAIRCNLVTLSDDKKFQNKTMLDYSAGEISDYEAAELIEAVQKELGNHTFSFHAGISYRNCMLSHVCKQSFYDLTPPHDISDKRIGSYLPNDSQLLDLIKRSYDILNNHPVNKARVNAGKRPANSIWLWGAGTKPNLESFEKLFNLKGAVISAVDLLKGIAIGSGMRVINVDGATGKIDTNYEGKARACIKALTEEGYDYVYLHIEAPDECGHQGDVDGKVEAISKIDSDVVGYIRENMLEDFTLLIMPDHATPLASRTHTSEPVPYIIYRNNNEVFRSGVETYTESACKATGNFHPNCEELVKEFLFKNIMLADNAEDNDIDATIVVDESNATDNDGESASDDIKIERNASDNSIISSVIMASALLGSDNNVGTGSSDVVIGENSDITIVPIAPIDDVKGEFILPTTIAEVEETVTDDGLFDKDFVDPDKVIEEESAVVQVEGAPIAEVEGIKKSKKKEKKIKAPKPKKTLSPEEKKKRLIVYIIIAVLAVAILVTSIVTPILILNKDKIFVNDASDFAKVDKGNYYVLEKDVIVNGDLAISNPYSIDLQGHMLTVNGNLIINHAQTGELNIGTKKGKTYIAGGSVVAGGLILDCNGTINVTTNMSAKNVAINKSAVVKFADTLAVELVLNISGGDVTFEKEISFGTEAKMHIGEPIVQPQSIVNVSDELPTGIRVILNDKAVTDITFTGIANAANKFVMSASSTIKSITMSEFVEARIHGIVNESVIGGNKVIMTEKSAAKLVTGMTELWMNDNNDNILCVELPDGISPSYIINLETPQDINVELTEDAKVICSVTKVHGAARYEFRVGENTIVVDSTPGAFGTITCDLTSLVKEAGDHKILVTALGAEGADPDLIRPSKAIFTTYTHVLILDMPVDLLVTSDTAGVLTLSWRDVRFADEYVININGKSINYKGAALEGRHSIDVSQYMTHVGGYSIRIMARCASNPAVQSSADAMTSYEIYKPHNATLTLTGEIKDGNFVLNWDKVDSAKTYTLYKRSVTGQITQYFMPANGYVIAANSVVAGDVFYVKANAIGYYQDSTVSNEIIVTIE